MPILSANRYGNSLIGDCKTSPNNMRDYKRPVAPKGPEDRGPRHPSTFSSSYCFIFRERTYGLAVAKWVLSVRTGNTTFSDRYVIQRTPAVSSGINNLLKRISVLALIMPQEQGNVPVDYASPDQGVGEEQILLHIGSVHHDQSKSVGAHDGGSDFQSDIFHIEEIVSISNKPPAPEETPSMTGRHNGPKCAQPSFTSCSAGISSSVSEDLLPGSTPTRGNAGMTFSNFSQTNKTKEIHAGKEDGLDGDKSDDWSIAVQASESDK